MKIRVYYYAYTMYKIPAQLVQNFGHTHIRCALRTKTTVVLSQSFVPCFWEVFDEIETPQGGLHTFSPVKSEFAFNKLVFKLIVGSFIYTSLWQRHRSVPEGGLGYRQNSTTTKYYHGETQEDGWVTPVRLSL